MLQAEKLLDIHLRLHETTLLTAAHCASFRRTVGENRELVEQSIDLILQAKAALRRADEVLGTAPHPMRTARIWP